MSLQNLPPFTGSIVKVSLINGGFIEVPTRMFTETLIPGHDSLPAPSHSFLVENETLGKKVLYDLGIMKAWKDKLPSSLTEFVESTKAIIQVNKDVADHLTDASVPLDSINSIIWSHHHFDHTGDPSLFPKSTSLIVGPTFKSNSQSYPGYPLNPASVVCQDAFEGRELIELDFNTGLEIGGFKAVDFFDDGSFYLLQAQGHTHDHMCALARTSENKFIFFGGDAVHHYGHLRPNTHTPLPDSIAPSPLKLHTVCPGSLFEPIHPAVARGEDYRTTPFYQLSPLATVSLDDANNTLNKMQVFDANPDVLVIIAHDIPVQNLVPSFPESLNGWETKEYKELNNWRFLAEFEKAIEMAGQ